MKPHKEIDLFFDENECTIDSVQHVYSVLGALLITNAPQCIVQKALELESEDMDDFCVLINHVGYTTQFCNDEIIEIKLK